MKFLKALSDLNLALGDNASLFFDELPPRSDLVTFEGNYRSALNALIAHAIKVSTGAMKPPQTFVANPPLPPLNFRKKAFSANPDMSLFQGSWHNTNPQESISSLDIAPLDPMHVSVTAKYKDFSGQFLSKADWTSDTKIFKGGLSLRPGVSLGQEAVPPIFSSYTLANPTGTGTALVVTNEQGSILSSTASVDTFQRS
jgi:hypothetical protein